jgi:uncharacterized OB-fold protein
MWFRGLDRSQGTCTDCLGGGRVKGKKCKCGYATQASKPRCPRCGKATSDAEWKDSGRVLSAVKLKKAPEGFTVPMTLTVVAIDDKGPKVTCWSEDELAVGDSVVVVDMGGEYICEKQSPGAR